MAYCTKLSVTLTAWRRTVGWLMSDGLEGMLKEPVMDYLRVLAQHFPRGAEENYEIRLPIQCVSRPKFVTWTSRTGEGMLITESWRYTHTHTVYIINHLILYACYRAPLLGIYKVINRYYWEMGIFECSYSRGSSVNTVTRLPEAHLLVVACRLALGLTEHDIQQILWRRFPLR
jgi:hypothetical protein